VSATGGPSRWVDPGPGTSEPDAAASELTTAVVLARGLGTRMKRSSAASGLSDEQRAAADAGAKAMMPTGGRPFLDFLLSALADAGITDVCLVIGPEHDAVRAYYDRLEPERLRIGYAVQERPLGTADAVLAAEAFVGDRRFAAVNGDNLYPAEALEALASVGGNALAGFDRSALARLGNIPPERMAAFAIVESADGWLRRIVEKPSPEVVAAAGEHALISMNCWAFTPAVFDACRRIAPSPRGEFEIVDAAGALVGAGHPVRVVPVEAGVLDLSSAGDVASVEAFLRGRAVRL